MEAGIVVIDKTLVLGDFRHFSRLCNNGQSGQGRHVPSLATIRWPCVTGIRELARGLHALI